MPEVLAERLDKLRALLAQSKQINEDVRDYVGVAKQWALRHTEYRLRAEVAYLTDLLADVSDLVLDARNPSPRKVKER